MINEQEYSQQFPGLLSRDILSILRRDYGFKVPEDFSKNLHAEDFSTLRRLLESLGVQ